MLRSDLISGLVVMAFALLAIIWILPTWGGQSFGRGMPPQFMPSIGAWAMLICGGALVVQSAIKLRRDGSPPRKPGARREGLFFTIWPILYVAASVFLVNRFGLIVSGPFIIAVLLFLIGERRPIVVIIASLAPPALIYLVAVHMMRVGMI